MLALVQCPERTSQELRARGSGKRRGKLVDQRACLGGEASGERSVAATTVMRCQGCEDRPTLAGQTDLGREPGGSDKIRERIVAIAVPRGDDSPCPVQRH